SPVTEFINIPVQRNYRTNIISSLLTSPATFNIVIDSTFDGEYNSDDMLDKVVAEGGEFKLFADMTIDESMTIEAVINVDNTTMTVGNGGHGVFVPQGAKDLKINFTNSTITGSPYALYLMQTNSVVTFDANSTVNEFWVMGGNVDVIYSGTKPVVKTDGLALNLNFYTKDEYAFSDVFDADGGELTFTEDLTLSNSVTVAAGQDVKLNLDGNKLNVERRSIVNGNLNINGGDIDVNIPTTSSIQMGFVADNGSQIDIVDANITVAPKNTAITIFNTDYNYHNLL
ncbi:MAG: hypothetical protein IKA41_02235, partial [Bacteroidaceae bacterium]|nr:hypothetical protein [Bacteroidaceae bacterium]